MSHRTDEAAGWLRCYRCKRRRGHACKLCREASAALSPGPGAYSLLYHRRSRVSCRRSYNKLHTLVQLSSNLSAPNPSGHARNNLPTLGLPIKGAALCHSIFLLFSRSHPHTPQEKFEVEEEPELEPELVPETHTHSQTKLTGAVWYFYAWCSFCRALLKVGHHCPSAAAVGVTAVSWRAGGDSARRPRRPCQPVRPCRPPRARPAAPAPGGPRA